MKKFKIEYKGWESIKEEFGLDCVYFNSLVYAEENTENPFPINLPYHIIEKQLVETIAEGAVILERLKKRISGWGPQESIYVKELEQCGIDMEMIFNKAVENNIDLNVEAIKWNKPGVSSSALNQIVDDLDDSLVDIKQSTNQYFLICERLEKVISNEILGLFPQLLNSSSDNILKFQHILVKHISGMGEELNDLLREC